LFGRGPSGLEREIAATRRSGSVPAMTGATDLLLGEDLLAWLVLALGAALAVGNGLALVRPPRQTKPGELTRAPVGRSLTMMVIGLVAAVWALASLASG
jgi:hypothetical protein